MEQKDYFSGHSKIYAAFRPTYPEELYAFIFKHLKGKVAAWDCGTGNGQVAGYLSKHFQHVYATDISKQQLDEAIKVPNIYYSESKAEHTEFTNNQFDLVTVGQAVHWFDAESFYTEVKRVGKKNGLIAVWGYSFLSVSKEIDDLYLYFYHNTVGSYWDYARKLVENEYKDIPFPFETINSPKFNIEVTWTRDQLVGYITSWSATQKFIKVNGYNPVENFSATLKTRWKDGESKRVIFPLSLKLGVI